VATLGINPSSVEFLDRRGVLLAGDRRRLATLDSLGLPDYRQMDADSAVVVIDECARYFERNPYRRWFDPLDRLLRAGAGVSYYDATACHLDLVQWATSPVWGHLVEPARERLLAEDEPFLARQLRRGYRLVLVNGRTVIAWTERSGLVQWSKVGALPGPPAVELFVGDGDGPTFLAWSCNLQSQPGAVHHLKALARFIGEHSAATPIRVTTEIPLVEKGSGLGSIAELVDELSHWLDHSENDRLGGYVAYGGTPWLFVDTRLGRMRLNADTRRDSITSFVSAARRLGSLRMRVIANRRGRVNKVVFDQCQEDGWYCYLEQALSAPAASSSSETVLTVELQPSRPERALSPSLDTAGGSPPSATASTVPSREVTNGGEATVVQFNHPGGEHVPRGNAMAWNTGPHKRKYLLARGAIVAPDGVVEFEGPLAFWGEWEPPSRVANRWPRQPGLPTVLHDPWWGSPPPGERQNTDPWVFGPEFLYSNCKQLNPSGSPSALQHLPRGSMILFGSTLAGQWIIDTVFVVAEAVDEYRPVDRINYGSEAFRSCTIESLATGGHASSSYTLFRGATPRDPVNGTFSFVPCAPAADGPPRVARPAIQLDGVVNPKSRQSPSGARRRAPLAEVASAWHAVVSQVLNQGLELAVDIAEPPRY